LTLAGCGGDGEASGSTPVPSTSTTTSVVEQVTVELWHCGVRPVTFAQRSWLSDDTDGTNGPMTWSGTGRMTLVSSDQAVYTDNGSGKVLEFEPLVGPYDPPPCA
jgi:hypothetical protein